MTSSVPVIKPSRTTHPTRRGNSHQKDTTIDHIMQSPLPGYIWVQQVGTVNNYNVASLSDHLPQWIKYAISIYVPRVPRRVSYSPTPRTEINELDLSAISQYNAELLSIIKSHSTAEEVTPEQSGSIIAAVCRASVEATKATLPTPQPKPSTRRPGRKTKYKKGYSTEMHIRQTYLHFYTTLIRVAFPCGKRRRRTPWSPHTHRQLLLRWIAQWTAHHAVLHSTMPLPRDIPAPQHILQLQYDMINIQYLNQCRGDIKKSLHATSRHHMRCTHNTLRSKVDDEYQSKHLGKVIQLLTAQPPSHCDLSTLHCPTEGQITDHYRIHCKVTEFFHDWYQVPPDLDPAAAVLTSVPDWWKSLLHPSASPEQQVLHPNSAIPAHLQKGLRKVCITKASPLIQTEIQQATDRNITF